MSARTKKIIWFIVIIFLLYWIWKDPSGAGSFVASVWRVIVKGFFAVVEFFQTLLAKT